MFYAKHFFNSLYFHEILYYFERASRSERGWKSVWEKWTGARNKVPRFKRPSF